MVFKDQGFHNQVPTLGSVLFKGSGNLPTADLNSINEIHI